MTETSILTYQTRIKPDEKGLSRLENVAALYGKIERSLFAELQKPNVDTNALKRSFLRRFSITARQDKTRQDKTRQDKTRQCNIYRIKR